MKKLFVFLLLISFILLANAGGALAASSYTVSLDKTAYTQETYMYLTVGAPSNEWYTVEILQGGKTLMSFSENDSFLAFPIYIPKDWGIGADFSFRAGRGTDVASVGFEIIKLSPLQVASVVAEPTTSSVSAGTVITLSTPTPGAKIYYTTNGTAPTTSSTLYTGSGITIINTTTIKAIAVLDGYVNSAVLEKTYSVNTGGGAPGGGPGGGGGGGSSSAPSTIAAGDGNVSVSFSQAKGTVTLDLPNNKLTEIIEKTKSGTATIDIAKLSGAINAVLPKTALTQLAGAGLNMEIKLPQGTVTLDPSAANSVAEQANGANVTVSLSSLSQADLTAAQRAAINPGDLVFSISVNSGNQAIHNFDGTITVTVPYNGEPPVAVWYINGAGALEKLDCFYGSVTKSVTFTISHLSLYVVGQDKEKGTPPPAPENPVNPIIDVVSPFTDVSGTDWFFNAVLYVYNNGLMTGTGTSPMLFSPNIPTTRAMIVTILYRRAGSPDVSGLVNPFSDVTSDTYYANAVKWAESNGIVQGIGGGKYGPEDNVTREQLATILDNYAKFTGLNLPELRQYPGFNDDASISGYASEAVERFFRAGIINGKPGNIFDPKGNATRAEVATMLNGFISAEKQ